MKRWPSEHSISTATVSSRGRVLEIVNGTRNGFATTPVTAHSSPATATSGSGTTLPTGTASTGTPASRSPVAACTGGGPSFQSPSETSTIARRRGWRRGAASSGSKRFEPAAAPSRVAETGSMRTS